MQARLNQAVVRNAPPRPRTRNEAPTWALHAYGSLACRAVCGPAPTYTGEREHTCLYLREAASARIDVEPLLKALSPCWCQNRS